MNYWKSEMFTFNLLLCAIFGHVVSNVVVDTDPCRQGDSYWCQNEASAVECGVLQYCKANNFITQTKEAAKPIQIDLYYESLCPGCREFITTQLYPAYQKLYSYGMFEIGLFPYGNADESKRGDEWKFECQHGTLECQLNLVETCALHLLSHPNQFMPFIHCLETKPSVAKAKSCAASLKIEWGPISKCYEGSEGNFLEHQIAVKTDALKPPHQYVPWIVVDGKHTEKIQNAVQDDLVLFICGNYKGPTPDACNKALESKKVKRCYKDDKNV